MLLLPEAERAPAKAPTWECVVAVFDGEVVVVVAAVVERRTTPAPVRLLGDWAGTELVEQPLLLVETLEWVPGRMRGSGIARSPVPGKMRE